MDTETIAAIAGLWPLVTAIFAFLLAIIFRVEIRKLFSQVDKFSVKKGDAELSIERNYATPAEVKPVAGLPEPAPPTQDALPPSGTSLAADNVDVFQQIRVAFDAGDEMVAETLYKRLQEGVSDQQEKYSNEARYLLAAFTHGRTDALERLRDMLPVTAPYPEASALVNFSIGQCYESVSDHERAIAFYRTARDITALEGRKVISARLIGISYCEMGQSQLGIEYISRLIPELSDDEAMSMAFAAIAEIYERIGNSEKRAIALEKAIDLQPNNAMLRFGAAYSHADAGLHSLAAFHYHVLLRFSPKDSTARNNLAVEWERLSLPIHAMREYATSWEQGETLSRSQEVFLHWLNEPAKSLMIERQLGSVFGAG